MADILPLINDLYMLIGIMTKEGLKDTTDIVSKAVAFLERKKITVHVCKNTCQLVSNRKPSLDFDRPYDFLLVFGGDGTLLRTLQFMKHFETALVPINMGRLGFFADMSGKEYRDIFRRLLSNKFHIESRMLLRCSVLRGSRRAFSKRALNEVTIARDSLARMVSLRTTVNDLKLTTYFADGLIIATPTGSTGYSLSSGGPVVSPQVDGIILTPISPHSFTQKPILLPHTSAIKAFVPSSGHRVYLTVDGQTGFHLRDSDIIKVKKSSKRLKLVRFHKNSYFQTLRDKLHWGSDLSNR